MRKIAGLTVLTVLLGVAARADTNGNCDHAFAAGFVQGGSINMHIRSSAIDVVGVDRTDVRVSCDLTNDDQRRNVTIRFRANGYSGNLDITGGPSNNTHFRIEVPAKTNLYVRMSAGDAEIRGVAGDKDVELYAGDLTITGIKASDYKSADASVIAGDLVADPFNVSKDGLFRSFNARNSTGKYKLHAHLMAGDLTIR